MDSLYDFSAKMLDGKEKTLAAYRGQVLMPDPASSGTGYFHVAAWIQMFGEEKAWAFTVSALATPLPAARAISSRRLFSSGGSPKCTSSCQRPSARAEVLHTALAGSNASERRSAMARACGSAMARRAT